MKKKISAFFLLLIIANFVTAQAKTVTQFTVTDIHLFTQTSYAGNIAVDARGKQLTPGFTIQMFMFLSVKGKEIPTWNKATFNSKTYDVAVIPYDATEIVLGIKQNTDDTVKLKAKTGFKLWKIELQPSITTHIDYAKTQTIKLSGEWKKNKVHYTINRKITQLQPEMHP
jgi:hypothetical protein